MADRQGRRAQEQQKIWTLASQAARGQWAWLRKRVSMDSAQKKSQSPESSPEVLYAQGPMVTVNSEQIGAWTERAESAPRKRYRLCAHQAADPVHEMLICLDRSGYIRPHRHHGKSESLHVIEGLARLILFEEDGRIRQQIPLGPYASGRAFFFRMEEPVYHTLWLETASFVFHETTRGPFNPADTEFAPWSPAEGSAEAPAFVSELQRAM